MISEDKKWKDLKQMAESLFDGNKEKAEKLIFLIQNTPAEMQVPPEFSNLKMELPEESCRWCFEGECFNYMPDSLFLCKGKCPDYEEKKEETI